MFIDTSVVGGCFDEEFDAVSRLLFAEFKSGKAIAVVSSLTLEELELAPNKVRRVLNELPDSVLEYIELDDDAVQLADEYIADGVVGQGSFIDAQQVAIASLNKVDVIVSWNFRHIVNLNRIRLFAATNLRHGLVTPEIRSPREVLMDYEEDI
ncbi:MAG: PIN domain protein [Armatimonadota bacterium]|nr:PIN domain protein [Armatimonadota bacterium]